MATEKSSTAWVMAALLTAATGLHAASWLTGWDFRKTITIDCGQIDADLTNFPVLVRLTQSTFDFGLAAPDGSDVRFADADGETPLSFERESHEAAVRAAAYWVKLPLVSASSNTTFYLYCGKSGATDGATPAAVWDEAHVGVWHLHQTNGVTQADSTAAGNHLTVGPAGLDHGDVAISDCGSTADWSVSGAAASLSVDTATKDTAVGSASSVKLTVASTAAGQTNTLTCNPAAPLALGNRRLDFYFAALGKTLSAGFSAARVYLYDTAGNYRYFDLNSLYAGISTGNTKGYSITSGGTTGGTAPDVNSIDRIEWFLVSANSTAYTFNIDTLYANGAMEQGASGAIAQAVSFSGNDHYLITAGQNIDTANGLSLSAWVRPRDRQVYGQTSSIVSFGGSNWSTYYQVLLGYYDSEQVTGLSSVSATFDPPYPDGVSLSGQGAGLTTGAWHHVAGVYRYDSETSNSTMKVYVDGVLRVDKSGAGRALRPLLARPVCVGAKTQTAYPAVEPQQHIRGELDEVRVSNVCRSEAWLKACYRNQKAGGALLSLADTESREAWLTGWKRRHRLTLNHAVMEADLTNFPVLVRLASDTFDFNHAASDGADIRFMSGDNKHLLPFERESHDAAARTAAYWVRLPLVSASSNTAFYLYCGKSGVTDGATPAAVWDAGHVSVWHLQQTNGVTQADSTEAGNALTIGPAGLDNGDVPVSDCDSAAGWSVTGEAASLSVDTASRDTIGGSASSVKLAVASTAAGQTNTLVYNPAEPLALGNRRLDFYYASGKSLVSGFSKAFVYLYDTNGNYRSHNLTAGSGTDNTKGYGIASGGTTGGSAPDVRAIDRIEWFFVSANSTAYTFNVDTLYANGALEEGAAGAIAKGVDFSGNDHYLITSALNIDTTNGLTLSAWVRQRDYQIYSSRSYLSIVNIGGGNIAPYYQTLLGYYKPEKVIGSTSVNNLYDKYPDGVTLSGQGTGFTTGAWHHVAGVYRYDPAASNTAVRVYVDGVLRVNTSIAGRALRPLLDKRVCLGAVTWSAYPDIDPTYHISGALDEVRISNVSRSEAWLKASFQNQKAADALLEVGRVEPPPGTVILLR